MNDLSIPPHPVGPAPVARVAPVQTEQESSEQRAADPGEQPTLAVRVGPAPLPRLDDPEDFVRRALSERAAIRSVASEVLLEDEQAEALPELTLPGAGALAPGLREHPVAARVTPQTQTVAREQEREQRAEEGEREALEQPLGLDDQRTQSAVAPHAGGLSHAQREADERGELKNAEHLLPKEEAAKDTFTQDARVEATADDPLVTRFVAS